MSKLVIFRGLPGSGKSTQAKSLLHSLVEDGQKACIVERDALRFMNGFGKYAGSFENTITVQQHALIRDGLKKESTVISSDTNLNAKSLKSIGKIAEHFGAGVEVIDIDIPLEECISRDADRVGINHVGEQIIRDFYKRYFVKGKFPANPLANAPAEVILEPYVRDESLPTAFVIDIDGTKAKMNGRSPYDYTKVHTDLPHEDILQLERMLFDAGHKIINLSGREESCFDATVEWLNQCSIEVPHSAQLFMRAEGDDRADYIIKYEIFRDKIAPYFNVLGVIDDRDQVVHMWRKIGLRCYQVADGNF